MEATHAKVSRRPGELVRMWRTSFCPPGLRVQLELHVDHEEGLALDLRAEYSGATAPDFAPASSLREITPSRIRERIRNLQIWTGRLPSVLGSALATMTLVVSASGLRSVEIAAGRPKRSESGAARTCPARAHTSPMSQHGDPDSCEVTIKAPGDYSARVGRRHDQRSHSR